MVTTELSPIYHDEDIPSSPHADSGKHPETLFLLHQYSSWSPSTAGNTVPCLHGHLDRLPLLLRYAEAWSILSRDTRAWYILSRELLHKIWTKSSHEDRSEVSLEELGLSIYYSNNYKKHFKKKASYSAELLVIFFFYFHWVFFTPYLYHIYVFDYYFYLFMNHLKKCG